MRIPADFAAKLDGMPNPNQTYQINKKKSSAPMVVTLLRTVLRIALFIGELLAIVLALAYVLPYFGHEIPWVNGETEEAIIVAIFVCALIAGSGMVFVPLVKRMWLRSQYKVILSRANATAQVVGNSKYANKVYKTPPATPVQSNQTAPPTASSKLRAFCKKKITGVTSMDELDSYSSGTKCEPMATARKIREKMTTNPFV